MSYCRCGDDECPVSVEVSGQHRSNDVRRCFCGKPYWQVHEHYQPSGRYVQGAIVQFDTHGRHREPAR